MATNDPTCSEQLNATDCLLKALLGAVDGQNEADDKIWDKLSFGFTVPVGILAALFTLITFVQVMITSGPGRRKSDIRIIGKWSSKRKTRPRWAEMRFLTIAETPVLKILSLRGILDNLTPDEKLHHNSVERQTGSTEASKIPAKWKWWKRFDHSLPMATTPHSSRARWLVHLHELDLEDLVFEKVDGEKHAADYLPDDLQAVPAYGEVGCIVALAAASGISSLRTTDQHLPYPLVIGKGFQLNFRDHPLLGLIGVFSRYGRMDVGAFRPSKHEVLLALYHAEGMVEAPRINHYTEYVSARRLYGSGHPFRPRCQCGGGERGGDLICSSAMLLNEKHKNVAWLLAAVTPTQVPAIFPSRSVKLRKVLTTFILQNKAWAYVRGSLLEDDIRSIFPSELGPARVWWTDDAMTELPTLGTGQGGLYEFLATSDAPMHRGTTSKHHPEYSFLLKPHICGALTEVFQLCLRFLYDSEEFDEWWHTLSEHEVEMHRVAVLVQIQQLDKLLAVLDPRLLECRKTVVYLTAQAFLIVEEDVASQMLDVGQLRVTPDKDTFWNGPKMHLFRHLEPTLKTLDTLLAGARGGGKDATLEGELTRQQARLETILSPWYSPHPDSSCPSRDALLRRLRVSVDGYKTVQEGVNGQRGADRDPYSAKINEVVDDLIIWRIVLLGLLFSTAPDNSTILDSGIWKHIIPLI